MPVFLMLVVLGVSAFVVLRIRKRQARTRLLATPLTAQDRRIVAEQVPLLARLPADLRPALEGKINRFLAQVDMIGCNGLDVTEEMEVSIAAQACLLVVNTDAWYDNLTTILIYPGAFKSRQTIHDGYVETEAEVVRTGESWTRGPVILSWRHSQQGALDDDDGHNVVLHEFAHQLDDRSGYTNGAPVMEAGQSLRVWEQVFVDAHARHAAKVERGHNTVIDPYGAHNHEEYFAVTVEMFFERPAALQQDEPQVYAQLAQLFRLDPVTWG